MEKDLTSNHLVGEVWKIDEKKDNEDSRVVDSYSSIFSF